MKYMNDRVLEIKKDEFLRLKPSVYLNDTLVNFYLQFLANYVFPQSIKKEVHTFNSYLMQKLKGNSSASAFNEDTFHLDYR